MKWTKLGFIPWLYNWYLSDLKQVIQLPKLAVM